MAEFIARHKGKIVAVIIALMIMSMSYSNGYADGCSDALNGKVVVLNNGESS